jgi:hypothetical protein
MNPPDPNRPDIVTAAYRVEILDALGRASRATATGREEALAALVQVQAELIAGVTPRLQRLATMRAVEARLHSLVAEIGIANHRARREVDEEAMASPPRPINPETDGA